MERQIFINEMQARFNLRKPPSKKPTNLYLTWVRNKIKNSKLSVIDRFEQGSFSKQNLVGNTHR